MTRFPPLMCVLLVCATATLYAQSAPGLRVTASGTFSSPSATLDFSYEWTDVLIGDRPIHLDLTGHPGSMHPDVLEVWSDPFTLPETPAELTYQRSLHIAVAPVAPEQQKRVTVTGLFLLHTWIVDVDTGEKLAVLDDMYMDSDVGETLSRDERETVVFTTMPDMAKKTVRLVTMLHAAPDALNPSKPAYTISPVTGTQTGEVK